MSEPTTTTAASIAMGTVAAAGLIPSIDGATLIGALAGSLIFMLNQKEGGRVTRFAYGGVSGVIGYMGSGQVMALTPITDPAIAAFALAATVVALVLTAIEKIRNFDFSLWGKK